MTNLDEMLDDALKRKTEDPNVADAIVKVGDKSLTFRFTEMEPQVWAGCTLASIARNGVVIDALFGYDVTAAAVKAAPLSGVQIVDGSPVDLTPAQWSKLFGVLESAGFNSISDAVLAVNEDAQLQRMEQAKKALGDASKRKRPSHAN